MSPIIDYFNDSFYVVDSIDHKVYRYTTNFTLQESFHLDPDNNSAKDITYDPINNSFWIMNDNRVFRYNTNFTRNF